MEFKEHIKIIITENEKAFAGFMKGQITVKELQNIVGDVSSIATKKEIESFLKNNFMIQMQSDTLGIDVETIKKQAKKLLKHL